jgi:two-component sensor histidine kinase
VTDEDKPRQFEQILETPGLSEVLEGKRFKQFLDYVPIAIAVSEARGDERVIYVNETFQTICGVTAGDIVGLGWDALDCVAKPENDHPALSRAIIADQEYLGSFRFNNQRTFVDAWSNVIEDDAGAPSFRLVAMAPIQSETSAESIQTAQQLREKVTLLRELQHRVKNNLQMITALIRMESRQLPEAGERFDRLAGRVEALSLLYEALSEQDGDQDIDLGIYLSQVAAAVMRAHGVEGIRLDLKVDTWPVSVNIAMPTGLVVNELLTNALKHGFKGRNGGTITLRSLVDEKGCVVKVADNGVGLPDGAAWPQPRKLIGLIVQSLTQNAGAAVDVHSTPGAGVEVTIRFDRPVASSGAN